MSDWGTLRDNLESIRRMLPLTAREKHLALMQFQYKMSPSLTQAHRECDLGDNAKCAIEALGMEVDDERTNDQEAAEAVPGDVRQSAGEDDVGAVARATASDQQE